MVVVLLSYHFCITNVSYCLTISDLSWVSVYKNKGMTTVDPLFLLFLMYFLIFSIFFHVIPPYPTAVAKPPNTVPARDASVLPVNHLAPTHPLPRPYLATSPTPPAALPAHANAT